MGESFKQSFCFGDNHTDQFQLTGPDELRMGGLAVALTDGVHGVCVVLPAACVCEETHGVCRPALAGFASIIHCLCHVVEGVVGGFPGEDDHVAVAVMAGSRVSRSTGDCGNNPEDQMLEHS